MRDEIKLYLFLGSWMALVIFIGGGYILYDSYSPESIQQDEDMGLEVIAEEEYSQDEEINVILSSVEGPVEGAQAELNGEEIGTTDENGQIRFTSETGVNTVQFNYEGQELSETVEVISDEDERSDGSSEEDQEQDGQGPESETESESETGEEIEIEITYDPENPSTNDQVTFEASTNAEAETYEWSSFDTQLQEDQGQQIQNRFESPGIYQINVEIETENQETIQESIEIEVQESDSDETEVGQEPEITLNSPSETQTYDEGSIDFEFIVENGVQGSEYLVVIDESSEIARMLPEEGENQITEELTLSTGEYETYIQLNQNGETYKSETITLDIEEQIEQPEFTLDSPNDGETIETFDDKTDVEFEFTVEDRAWAEEAKIEIEQTQHQDTRLISSYQEYIEDFNLESSEEGISYDWIVTLKDEGSQVSSEKSFNIVKESPEFRIFEQTEEVRENGYEVDFYLEFKADVPTEITAYYIDGQEQEDVMSSEYVDEENLEFEFSQTFSSEGEYSWYVEAEEIGSKDTIKISETSSFEISDLEDDEDLDSPGGGGGGGD